MLEINLGEVFDTNCGEVFDPCWGEVLDKNRCGEPFDPILLVVNPALVDDQGRYEGCLKLLLKDLIFQKGAT